MSRVLVTGGSGYVGGHLVERLVAEGQSVRCLVRGTSSRRLLQSLDVECVVGDLSDGASLRRALAGADTVYHVGGLTSAVRTADFSRINGGGTSAVLDACAARTSPPTVIYVSSIAAAGPARKGQPKREADAACPVSHYGRSKRQGELAALHCAARVPITIVRPGVVFGPRNRDLLPVFRAIRHLRTHAYPGFVAPPLSYIEVRDLARLLIAAADRGHRLPSRLEDQRRHPGRGIYFATANETPNYAEFGRLIARAMNISRCLIVPLSFPLPWVVAAISEGAMRFVGRSSLFNVDKIREAAEASWAFSGEAAFRDLQFQPSASLVEQLRQNAEWYEAADWF